jgi:GNAT superfamily N-acetyltransferase
MESEMMRVDLTDLWRFQPDPAGSGEARGYAAPAYDHRIWREVRLPADFEACHPVLDTYEGAGWFRRWVSVPVEWRGRRVLLHFEGVNAHARAWVNGVEVGSWDDPFLPFGFEAQGALNFGEANLVAVRVDNERRLGEVPGRQRGWRNYGGILREVTLEAMSACYLDHIRTLAEPVNGGGHLTLSATVVNTLDYGVQASLQVTVRDSEGREHTRIGSAPQLVSIGERLGLSVASAVPGVRAWSPSDPVLATVEVSLRVRDQTVDTRSLRVGFRTVEVSDGQLRLNGEPITLTGFNRHEDSPERNMRPDLALARRDLEAMKAAGANFVRLCHYPHHPGELDLCDELGLLVMDEIPLYWWNGLEEGDVASVAKLDAAKRQLTALVARDRNHPSVIFWSVSNETHEERPEVAAGNASLVQLARALDSTRLAVHVSDHWREHPSFDEDDVICVNAYPSIGPLVNSVEADEPYDLALSTAFWREELAVLHARYPAKPILVTEFGYTSFYGVDDNAFGGDLHADVIEAEFAGLNAPYVCGATIWCWADHAWPPATFAFCGHLATSPYGLLTRDRRRKPAFYRARTLYRARQGLGESAARIPGPMPTPSGWEVTMVRPHMSDIPQVAFPDGYSARPMRPDDGGVWADIWRDADEFGSIGPELFLSQFGDDPAALQWRGFIVENDRGLAVATITAWYNRSYKGEDYGQIHWVAVRQAFWGHGLGKAMMTHALNAMAQWHERAFLGTQTRRLAAIKVYLDFGFVPDLRHDHAREAWREVAGQLAHPTLAALDLD